MADHDKSAAQLQREIDQQRTRVESTIEEIRHRITPGRLLDEALSYTRGGPGAAFMSNLGGSVQRNPLPVLMLGLGAVWVIAEPYLPKPPLRARRVVYDTDVRDGYRYDNDDDYHGAFGDEDEYYPLASIDGSSLQRMSRAEEDGKGQFSHFVDEAGRRYKALTDEAGNRAGHFVDDAGNSYRGFVDAAGKQISHFRDEAGELLDEATGWASHTWQDARERMAGSGGELRHQAGRAAGAMRSGGGRAVSTANDFLRDQPLVAGLIAVALGAAAAAIIPRSRQEDEMMGEASDSVKDQAAHEAGRLYEEGKERAGEMYGKARDAAETAYKDVKEGTSREGSTEGKSETNYRTH